MFIYLVLKRGDYTTGCKHLCRKATDSPQYRLQLHLAFINPHKAAKVQIFFHPFNSSRWFPRGKENKLLWKRSVIYGYWKKCFRINSEKIRYQREQRQWHNRSSYNFLPGKIIYEFSFTNIGFLSFGNMHFLNKINFCQEYIFRHIREKAMPFPSNCRKCFMERIFFHSDIAVRSLWDKES